MALPKKLKYFNMFFDGDNYFGMVPEITPAKLTKKTEDYQAGGMPGSVAVDLGSTLAPWIWISRWAAWMQG